MPESILVLFGTARSRGLVPQGLKPASSVGMAYGPAEAVPLLQGAATNVYGA